MFKLTFAAALAAIAAANEPHLYVAEPNDKYDVTIQQVSGQENFIMLDQSSYADPNPVIKNNTEKFYIGGIWNVDGSAIEKVNFTCKLAGVVAYDVDYPCTAAASTNDYGNCVKPAGNIGEMWSADFGFDVPAIAPPFEYDVTVTAYDGAGNSLWAVASAFYIP